ncbi:hypothetical protein BTJ68_06203 [Hortaea werneckii EXF-2000]|uniref:Apple domain-containing protein n=1 Tax=Hortaea werneckii EXF-2000 TaxID=1157616 RepID=A0A1Z5T860_HORWE|nr:hypothetical protein BTJ68_06203 [Hortaea werneckii EXF-2000]
MQPSGYAIQSSSSTSTPLVATGADSSATTPSRTPPAVSPDSNRSSQVLSTSSIASSQPNTISTTISTQFTPGPYATPTFNEPPPDEAAPSCPADPAESCENTGDQSVCSSDNGAAYGLTCNVAYTGTVLSPPSYKIRRQSEEPSFQDCANLCDATTGCVAFNYIDTQCTMFSEVTGTYYAPGAVGATQITSPTDPDVELPPATIIGLSPRKYHSTPNHDEHHICIRKRLLDIDHYRLILRLYSCFVNECTQ